MKLVLKQKQFKILHILFSVTTVILGAFSFFNIENWLLRICMQGSLSLMALFLGLRTISEGKVKKTGYLLIGTAIFLLFVMINTIVVGFKIGAI